MHPPIAMRGLVPADCIFIRTIGHDDRAGRQSCRGDSRTAAENPTVIIMAWQRGKAVGGRDLSASSWDLCERHQDLE